MACELSDETEFQVPAAKAWELYAGDLNLVKFLPKHLPDIVEKIDVLEGDGGEGTLLQVTFAPALGGVIYKEKFTRIDNENRITIAEMVEGGYLDLGFTHYRIRFEVIEKGDDRCIVKSTIEYAVKEEAAANASLASVEPLRALAQAANNYLINQQAKDE